MFNIDRRIVAIKILLDQMQQASRETINRCCYLGLVATGKFMKPLLK